MVTLTGRSSSLPESLLFPDAASCTMASVTVAPAGITVLPLSSLIASPTAAVMVWPGLWVREEISWPAVSPITVPAATVRVLAAGAGAAGTAAGAGDGGAAGSVRWGGVVPVALCLGAEDFAPGGAGG